MIDSSLIAGLQPTGSALLLTGGVGPVCVVAAAAAVNTGGAAGATAKPGSDGFRERFEASFEASVELAGPEMAPADGRTIVSKGGGFGQAEEAQLTGGMAGLRASLGQRKPFEGERMQDASEAAGDGAKRTEQFSGPQFSGPQVCGAQVFGTAEEIVPDGANGTRTGTVAQPLSFVVDPAPKGDAARKVAETVLVGSSRVQKKEDRAASDAPVRVHAATSLKAGLSVINAPLIVGGTSLNAVISAPKTAHESGQEVQAAPLPQTVATITNEAASAAVTPAKRTPVARVKLADTVAHPAVEQRAEVTAAAIRKPEPPSGKDQASGGLTATEEAKQPVVMSLAAPVVGTPVSPVQVSGLPGPVVAMPGIETSETQRARIQSAPPNVTMPFEGSSEAPLETKGKAFSTRAEPNTGAGVPLTTSSAVLGVSAPSLLKNASDDVEAPLAQASPGAAINANDPAAARLQSHVMRAGDRPLTSQSGVTVSDAGSLAKDAGSSPAVVDGLEDTGGSSLAAPDEMAQSIGMAWPSLTVRAEAPPVVAGAERGGAAVKAVGSVRGSSSAQVTAGASGMGTAQAAVSPLQTMSERADAPANGKEPGEVAVGAKAVPHVDGGTTPGVAAATISPQMHVEAQREVPGETKTCAAAFTEQTSSERTHASSGMAGSGEGLEPTMLVATPHVLEVGVASGTNGWLRVRAEMDGTGSVVASVMTTTASAAEALHKELPSLAAYLRDESVGVSSLVVNRAQGGTLAHDATASFGAGSFGAGSQAGRGGQASPSEAAMRQEMTSDGIEPALLGMRPESRHEATPGAGYGAASGGWLNVVA